MDDRGVVGPPYPTALRLYFIASENWAEIEAAYYQVDLLRVSARKLLNLVYAWCVHRIAPERREEWDAMLTAPLEGQVQATDRQIEQEGDDFMAAMAMHTQLTSGG